MKTYRVIVIGNAYGAGFNPDGLTTYKFKAETLNWLSGDSVEASFGEAVWPILGVSSIEVLSESGSWIELKPPTTLTLELELKRLAEENRTLLILNAELKHKLRTIKDCLKGM